MEIRQQSLIDYNIDGFYKVCMEGVLGGRSYNLESFSCAKLNQLEMNLENLVELTCGLSKHGNISISISMKN